MARLTFIIWQVQFAIWSQNHVPLGKVTSSHIPTAVFIYWESMFSPYCSTHSGLFIWKLNTLTIEQHRLHFPKREIKFLSSQSSANYWHTEAILNQWILALLVSFQGLAQGSEKGSLSLSGFTSSPAVSRSRWGRAVFCRAGGRQSQCLGSACEQPNGWGPLCTSRVSPAFQPQVGRWNRTAVNTLPSANKLLWPHTHFLVKN